MAKNKSSEGAQAQPKPQQKKPRALKRERPLEISPENRDIQERATEVAEQALETARQFDALEFAKKNAVPMAILGLSAYWLYSESQRPKNLAKMARMKGKVKTQLSEIKGKAGELKHKASDSLGEYSGSAQQALAHAGDNPLIVAAFAGGIGLALGMVLPLTALENETFKSARATIKESIQEKVEQVQDAVSSLKEKAAEVKDKVEATVSAN